MFFVSNLYKGAKICDFDGDAVKLNLYEETLEKSRVLGTAGKHKVILILDLSKKQDYQDKAVVTTNRYGSYYFTKFSLGDQLEASARLTEESLRR